MNPLNLTTDQILIQIASQQLTPEAGLQLLKKFRFATDQNNSALRMTFCYPHWEQEANNKVNTLPRTVIPQEAVILLFDTEATRYAECQQLFGPQVVWVKPGDNFQDLGPQTYCLNPKQPADYRQLLSTLIQRHQLPTHIIHFWSQASFMNDTTALETQLEWSLYSVFHLTQALLEQKPTAPIKLLYVYLEPLSEIQPQYAAMSGLAKTVRLENAKLIYQTLAISTTANLFENIAAEFTAPTVENDLRYHDHQRWVKRLQELDSSSLIANDTPPLLTKHGVYLITGGLGGLGLIFAEYLAAHFQAKLVLTGRSALDETHREKIKNLNQLGAEVIYQVADVSKRDEVINLIAQIKSRFHQLNGIIHSAGVIKDAVILKKTPETVAAVLAPKVYGTVYLDEATQTEPLDFFVLFSSLAARVGNVGQCDYAYANSFMDHFASFRDQLRKVQQRSGKTLAINWPLWQEGGMRMNKAAETNLEKRLGLFSLPTAAGLQAFITALRNSTSQLAVAYGDTAKIHSYLGIATSTRSSDTAWPEDQLPHSSTPLPKAAQLAQVVTELLNLCAELLKVKAQDLDLDTDLGDYGVDSIMMITLLNRLEAQYGQTLEPNAILEYPTIKRLAEYLVTQSIAKGVTSEPRTATYGDTVAIHKPLDLQTPLITPKVTAFEENTPPSAAPASKPHVPNKPSVITELLNLCSELLKVNAQDLDIDTELGDYGVDSIMMMTLLNRLETQYGKTLEPNVISEYPTLRRLAEYLMTQNIVKVASETPPKFVPKETIPFELNHSKASTRLPRTRFVRPTDTKVSPTQIAVIGMACRFPGATSPELFWDNLVHGRQLISEVPATRWNIADYYSSEKGVPHKTYSKWGGYIDNIEAFDADYFGITEADALVMDPQHRLLLELSQELLDRAGYQKAELERKRVGVFIGGAENFYVRSHLDKVPRQCRNVVVGAIQNMMAARIADFYNFTGPALTTDTACSSSLVALHQACQSMQLGESELAIVGGIELLIDPFPYLAFSKAEVLSDEDKCYVFDARAKGLVLGEGAGLVLLKPLEAAREAGDTILGVITGSAVNNDGHTMGLTVPNLAGQQQVIQEALRKSQVDPATITYLEAHGTGTLLGDPIEIKAVTQVYRQYTPARQYCAVGSVKSNMGHLLHAAGIASFIKVVLALQHRKLPPTLNCENPHPRFNFPESPVYPITQATDWHPRGDIRRAAISSFGFGGTNCHLILEEFAKTLNQTYQPRRPSLPLTQFHRKRYWLGQEIMEVQSSSPQSGGDLTFYQELLAKLSQGTISPEQAMQITKAASKTK